MSEKRRIVLDTNCLVAALARHSEYYPVWSEFQAGKYILCISNEILEEYQEIIERKTSAIVAQNVVNLLLKSHNVDLVTPSFKFRLIDSDHDDDKFVDCAFAANATFIVSDDNHFAILKEIQFPKLLVLKLKEFLGLLKSEGNNNVEPSNK